MEDVPVASGNSAELVSVICPLDAIVKKSSEDWLRTGAGGYMRESRRCFQTPESKNEWSHLSVFSSLHLFSTCASLSHGLIWQPDSADSRGLFVRQNSTTDSSSEHKVRICGTYSITRCHQAILLKCP